MKNIRLAFFSALIACLVTISIVLAQAESLNLTLTRDWGYSGFNGEVQGTCTIKVSGPTSLSRVDFFLDGTKIGEASQPPFNLQFVTDNYPAGAHILSAVGTTSDGGKLSSNQLNTTFISNADSGKKMVGIIVPILAVAFGAIILSAIVPLMSGRKIKNLPAGAPRSYPFGGRICPKCGRPFPLKLYNINLVTGKLARCPYCGQWSLSGSVSLEKLRAAEQAELETEKVQFPQTSEEEKYKKELDDSRYQGL
jgi:ribosomal protein L32